MDKTRLKNIQTNIFDYDGTLHDSTANYIAAFKMAYNYLIENKKADPREWKDKEITKWLGYSSKDMWENFMPNLDAEHQATASKIIGETLLKKSSRKRSNSLYWSFGNIRLLKT
ncbi:HAD family hydrolase [Carnobacterium jeotgali]|uniref:HAD family hydrolase n=1 Tax=Carnobacterium jeotgali TaxID=545534 RepID=UPI000A83B704|nr:HAD hydrolase-like protein [Carnobacterium jeotgali]